MVEREAPSGTEARMMLHSTVVFRSQILPHPHSSSEKSKDSTVETRYAHPCICTSALARSFSGSSYARDCSQNGCMHAFLHASYV